MTNERTEMKAGTVAEHLYKALWFEAERSGALKEGFALERWAADAMRGSSKPERTLACALADGYLYDNWPWTKLP